MALYGRVRGCCLIGSERLDALGPEVIGNIGSKERHEFTAIGVPVNTAARLESKTKELGHPLVMSPAVKEALEELAGELTDLGDQPLKGRAAIRVWGWKPA